ncbi:carbohydrate kinase family protein [Stratiformator vulcanicus]|uniref:Putative sugar kinase YdjH n=1 Tax=Stratiformator vulcanicus TaxID=2527980 RepID=A0A517R1C9_9PLAN|nr:carbohydrate kinase [Stratiformator vulcanicus]QDT37653.1 putative sugar kinase YdjH [Stratiformator vulcanicus]
MDRSKPVAVGLGELLWDIFEDGERPGGAPANVAYHANQLGLRGVIVSRVGSDERGNGLLDHLQTKSLSRRYVQQDETHPTGTVTVHNANTGPAYSIHEDVAWDYIDATDDVLALMREADAICFGSLAQRTEQSRKTIQRCLDAGSENCLKVFDVNLRPPHNSADVMRPSATLCNVLKLNEDEVPDVAEMLGMAEREIEPFAKAFAESQNAIVAITLGSEGCLLSRGDEIHRAPSKQVEVADTVGAGDSFTAGLVYGLLHDWPLEKVGRFANRIGGLVASSEGAMPDLEDDFAQLKREFEN